MELTLADIKTVIGIGVIIIVIGQVFFTCMIMKQLDRIETKVDKHA